MKSQDPLSPTRLREQTGSPDLTTVVCRTRAYRVDEPKIKRMTSVICGRLGVESYQVSINLVGSRTIRRLNREFRSLDKSTDVLSFPQVDWASPRRLRAKVKDLPAKRIAAPRPQDVLGDVVISLPDAASNAKRIGQPLARELGFLLVHGILHLCGHDHMQPAEERRMREAQRKLMRALGEGKAQPLWLSSVKPRAKRRMRAD